MISESCNNDRFSNFDVEEIISWLGYKDLIAFGVTGNRYRIRVFDTRVWRQLCKNSGMVLPPLVSGHYSSDFDHYLSWMQVYFGIFGHKAIYPLRDFLWKTPPDEDLLNNICERYHQISYESIIASSTKTSKGCRFAVEIFPNSFISGLHICFDYFNCSIQTLPDSSWALVVYLADRSGCAPNCNCTYRGKIIFLIRSYILEMEFSGCYSHKTLPFELEPDELDRPLHVILYVSAVKGFRADPLESLQYT
mmetsp:Transcript_8263/g.8430  ORF Transcript_8263/g.8430 Transcript_8263/m.8430 type:complete len:250 (-) Transcript_8263:54-803(-)